MHRIFWQALHLLPYILVVFAIVVCILLSRMYRVRAYIDRIVGPLHRRTILRGFSYLRMWTHTLCIILCAASIAIASLRPGWDGKKQEHAQEGRDVLIAIDISRSMLTQDIAPSRLEHVHKKIRALLDKLTCERVGLILFAGSAIMQCPLTADYGAFYTFLNVVTKDTVGNGSTSLEQPIRKAIDAFKSTPERKNKLLVIFTDGEDFSRDIRMIQEARDIGLHIITVGIGTPIGGPIPLYDAHGTQIGYQKDEHGGVVISKRNDQLLSHMAQETGGAYVATTEDDYDIREIVRTISRFEKETLDAQSLARLEEGYVYPLRIALFSYLLAWILL